MAEDMESVQNRARIALGMSIVAGVVALGWFLTQGDVGRGVVAFFLLAGVGGWEYRRRMQSERVRRTTGRGNSRVDDSERK